MSGLPAPGYPPKPPAVRPEVVPPRPKKSRRWGRWIALAVLVVIAAGGLYLWIRTRPAASSGGGPGAPSAIRTARIVPGPVERTVRLTGVTAAANFASLITPRLIGSRTGFGRDSSSAVSSASQSSGSSSSSSSSSASSSSASKSSSSSAPNASSAFTAATSRVGSSSSSSSSSSTSSSNSSSSGGSSASALGSSGLGSTSDSLPNTSGGDSGGGNDFMLVLQNVAPGGTIVKKGAQVAEFDRQYMLLRLDDYQASVVQSEASLKKRKATLDISHKSHEQLVSAAKGALEKARLDLKTIPVLSDIDAERARLAFQQAEAKYNQLLKEVPFVLASEQADTRISEFNVEKAKQEQKRAQMNADKMLATTPLDGLVVMQSTFRGADFGQIQQGDQLYPGMFYMQVVDPRSMVINATINQSDVEQVRIGQKARVHFDAYPDLTLPAHVESVAAVSRPAMFPPTYFREVAVRA